MESRLRKLPNGGFVEAMTRHQTWIDECQRDVKKLKEKAQNNRLEAEEKTNAHAACIKTLHMHEQSLSQCIAELEKLDKLSDHVSAELISNLLKNFKTWKQESEGLIDYYNESATMLQDVVETLEDLVKMQDKEWKRLQALGEGYKAELDRMESEYHGKFNFAMNANH